MADPRIPYIDIPVEIPPHSFPSIKVFGILVAIGVYVGAIITMRRAKARRLDGRRMSDFIFWVVATGFVLSHVLDAIFYHPDTVAKDPIYLLKIWDGLSSYGGFIGAVTGAFLWRLIRRRPILEFVDVTVSAFPVAWVFGRLGCSVVHDHPGALTTSWIGVRYPVEKGGAIIDGVYHGRFDLGLYEMVLTIPIAALCWILWRKKPFRPSGFYVGLTLVYYAPIRFALDFLRVGPEEMGGAGDPRYMGLTPAQWACFLGLAGGLFFLRRGLDRKLVAEAAARAEVAAADALAEKEAIARGEDPNAEATPDDGADDPAEPQGTARERARARRGTKTGSKPGEGKKKKKRAKPADEGPIPGLAGEGEADPPAEAPAAEQPADDEASSEDDTSTTVPDGETSTEAPDDGDDEQELRKPS